MKSIGGIMKSIRASVGDWTDRHPVMTGTIFCVAVVIVLGCFVMDLINERDRRAIKEHAIRADQIVTQYDEATARWRVVDGNGAVLADNFTTERDADWWTAINCPWT